MLACSTVLFAQLPHSTACSQIRVTKPGNDSLSGSKGFCVWTEGSLARSSLLNRVFERKLRSCEHVSLRVRDAMQTQR